MHFVFSELELEPEIEPMGLYEVPFTDAVEADDEQETGSVYTIQHVDGWKYGDNYFFFDYTDLDDSGTDLYGEFYANFSLGKITGDKVGFWRVKDVGILAGVNWGRDTKILKYLPGVRLSWDLPGIAFLNTDFTAYIDDNKGLPNGIPKEDNSYMVDINWGAPFSIGEHNFSIEGHVEYIGRRDNEFGETVSWHVLGQPQFRYDLGKTWFGVENRLFVGVEWQFWINKNDDSDTNESAPQLLIVGRF
ncbi:hypothetical protein N5D83_03735 [Pseudomonas chengduensis]|nr:hypothetical protein [Pseudomonas chengduensis]MDH1865930.1 hypothetical protein [Pseudomonas chengduensis]